MSENNRKDFEVEEDPFELWGEKVDISYAHWKKEIMRRTIIWII
jgi:hypothetical protein